MWFLFGGVPLILWICVELWRRHLFRWRPHGVRDGLEYNYGKDKNGKVTSINIGISCPIGANFSIKRQSAIDSFCKKMKVSNEFESDDPAFDDLFYVISNNHQIQKILVSSQEFRNSIKQIFAKRFPAQAKALHCRRGRLWVVLKPTNGGDEDSLKSVTGALKSGLGNIKRELEALPKSQGALWHDPFVFKAVILLAVSSGMAINGATQLFRISWSHLPVTYDLWPLFWDAVKFGSVGLGLLVVFSIYWLGRSARTHLVLIELLTIGLLGSVATAYTELRDWNMEFDKNPPVWIEATVVDKQTRKGRKGGRKYYLVMNDWNCDCGKYRMRVSYGLYDRSPSHGVIQVLQHPGRLGYRWIEDVTSERRIQAH